MRSYPSCLVSGADTPEPFRTYARSKTPMLRRLLREKSGQGLVEYSLIVLLVVFIFWLGVKDTNIGNQISASWSSIASCLGDSTVCT